MIRIARSKTVPTRLRNKGPDAITFHTAQVAAGVEVGFDSTIYGHATVKKKLVALQYEKCAYCEWKVTPGDPGDVEHFRPKGRVKQVDGDPFLVPGYWWLAYEWDNLLFACSKCNSSGKRDLFPIADQSKRCRKPTDALAGEEALLLNPVVDHPETQIEWRGAVPRGTTLAAKTTITELGLRRKPLMDDRNERYDTAKLAWENIKSLEAKADPADAELLTANRRKLAAMLRRSAEYAGMIRAAMRNGFQQDGRAT